RRSAASDHRRLSALRAAELCRRSSTRQGLWLARADRRRNARPPGRSRRPDLRRAHVGPDRSHHRRHDRDRDALPPHRSFADSADRELDGRALGSTAPMRARAAFVWTLAPAVPFALALVVWVFVSATFDPSKETLPSLRDVVSATRDLAVSGELASNVLASLGRLLLGG